MKGSFPTLDQIRDIIKEEGKTIIVAFDRDLKLLEGRVGNVEDTLMRLEKKVDDGFEENYGAHQEILGVLDTMCDQKIKKHCDEKHSFATS